MERYTDLTLAEYAEARDRSRMVRSIDDCHAEADDAVSTLPPREHAEAAKLAANVVMSVAVASQVAVMEGIASDAGAFQVAVLELAVSAMREKKLPPKLYPGGPGAVEVLGLCADLDSDE